MSKVDQNERISTQVAEQVGVAAGAGVDFVATGQIQAAAREAGLDSATAGALVDDYGKAQILSLKAGLLATALLVLGSLAFTRDLPRTPAASGDGPADRRRRRR